MMKKILCKILCVMDAFARARAAAHLSRSGQNEAAQRIIQKEGQCKC